MTRNLWSWDRHADERQRAFKDAATARAIAIARADLREQGARQRKDWRFGMFSEAKRAADMKPEERCQNSTCECPWCESA